MKMLAISNIGVYLLGDFPDFSDYYFTPVKENATASLRYTWLGDIIFYLLPESYRLRI